MVLDMTPPAEGQIAAGRFVLRPLRVSDTGLIAHHAGDVRVAEATQSIPHPFPPGAAEAYVTRAMTHDRPGSVWVMDGALTGLSEVLGVISLKPMEMKAGQGGQSEVAYWVAPAFWNTGIASEAVRALVAANPLADRTYFAEVFQDNPGSARVLTNAGFQYLGDAEAFSVARAAMVPTWTYLNRLS